MTPAPQPLEPAQRDPRKLWLTAWILVAIMVFGGFFILKAYDRFAIEKNADDRPAFVGRLPKDKDLRVILQDGAEAGINDLAGKVVLIHALSATQPESAALPVSTMQRLAAHYQNEPNVAFVSMVIDPGEGDQIPENLSQAAAAINAKLPRWWVATTADPAVVRKFLKNRFNASLMPHEANGEWVYDTSIVLVDRNRHIRRGIVPQKQGGPAFVANFDFEEAAKWDAKGVKTGTDRSNVEEMEFLLIKTIDQLLKEPTEAS